MLCMRAERTHLALPAKWLIAFGRDPLAISSLELQFSVLKNKFQTSFLNVNVFVQEKTTLSLISDLAQHSYDNNSLFSISFISFATKVFGASARPNGQR